MAFYCSYEYAPLVEVYPHFLQAHIPTASLEKDGEPQEGQLLLLLSSLYTLVYLFLSVAPYFAPKPAKD